MGCQPGRLQCATASDAPPPAAPSSRRRSPVGSWLVGKGGKLRTRQRGVPKGRFGDIRTVCSVVNIPDVNFVGEKLGVERDYVQAEDYRNEIILGPLVAKK